MKSNQLKYYAFISYSHQDKKWGDWLHKAIETYRVPKRLVGQELRNFDAINDQYVGQNNYTVDISSNTGSK
jgi:hypothetical protein